MAWMVHDYPDPPSERIRFTSDGLCPDCGKPYINCGKGAGVRVDGDVLCERCAKKFFDDNYTLLDLCEALGFEYIPDPE